MKTIKRKANSTQSAPATNGAKPATADMTPAADKFGIQIVPLRVLANKMAHEPINSREYLYRVDDGKVVQIDVNDIASATVVSPLPKGIGAVCLEHPQHLAGWYCGPADIIAEIDRLYEERERCDGRIGELLNQ